MKTTKDIENIPYLSKTALSVYLNKNKNTLRNTLAYWQKTGKIMRVKRGFYVFKNFLDKKDNALYYSQFLASKMIEPSYLSGEFVLQEYQMFTEAVYGYSSVTTKKTNSITNELGTFNYKSIKENLFIGFKEFEYGQMKWYKASKAKALFDYIYFNQNKFTDFSEKESLGLRLNLENMTKTDWREYRRYVKIAKQKKLDKIYKLMANKY